MKYFSPLIYSEKFCFKTEIKYLIWNIKTMYSFIPGTLNYLICWLVCLFIKTKFVSAVNFMGGNTCQSRLGIML